jgi:hypothetical protein
LLLSHQYSPHYDPVNAAKEAAWSGYDVKFSGQAPYLPWAKIKGTYYHWDTKTGPNIKGTKVSALVFQTKT